MPARFGAGERPRGPTYRYSLSLLHESETSPPFFFSRDSVSHVPQAFFLGGTPLSLTTVGTQWKQFVGRAEGAVTILQRTNLVTNLLAFEDRMAVLAAQKQVLAPISHLTIWTKRRERGGLPMMMAAMAVTGLCHRRSLRAAQHALLFQPAYFTGGKQIRDLAQVDLCWHIIFE